MLPFLDKYKRSWCLNAQHTPKQVGVLRSSGNDWVVVAGKRERYLQRLSFLLPPFAHTPLRCCEVKGSMHVVKEHLRPLKLDQHIRVMRVLWVHKMQRYWHKLGT